MSRANRSRNEGYLAWVREFTSCLGWHEPGNYGWAPIHRDETVGAEACVAHHVRMGGAGGMGLKPSDFRVVPLTDWQHKKLHLEGEKAFWESFEVDPRLVMISLLLLWNEMTHVNIKGETPDGADLIDLALLEMIEISERGGPDVPEIRR